MAGCTARRICWAVGLHCHPHCVARVKFLCSPCTPVRQNAVFHPGDVGSVGGRPVKFRDGPRLQDLQVARQCELVRGHSVSANELLPQRRVCEPRRGQAVLHGLRGGGSQREQGGEGGHEAAWDQRRAQTWRSATVSTVRSRRALSRTRSCWQAAAVPRVSERALVFSSFGRCACAKPAMKMTDVMRCPARRAPDAYTFHVSGHIFHRRVSTTMCCPCSRDTLQLTVEIAGACAPTCDRLRSCVIVVSNAN